MNSQGQTGTRDETYNIVSVLYHSLQGAETIQQYKQDASSDQQMSQFLDQAQQQYRQLADQAKQLLQSKLGQEGQQQQGGMSGSQSMGGQSSENMAGGASGGMSGGGSSSGQF